MPYGRGGAGNIQAVAQETERIATDLEANETIQEPSQSSDLAHHTSQQQHVHAGRGGAGNFYAAQEMKNVKASSAQSGSKLIESKQSEQTSRTPGRGGAGNYYFTATQNEQQIAIEKAKEERTREKIRRDIEQGVGEQLAMPQKAKLPHSQTKKR